MALREFLLSLNFWSSFEALKLLPLDIPLVLSLCLPTKSTTASISLHTLMIILSYLEKEMCRRVRLGSWNIMNLGLCFWKRKQLAVWIWEEAQENMT